jgi:hypothetical protein
LLGVLLLVSGIDGAQDWFVFQSLLLLPHIIALICLCGSNTALRLAGIFHAFPILASQSSIPNTLFARSPAAVQSSNISSCHKCVLIA